MNKVNKKFDDLFKYKGMQEIVQGTEPYSVDYRDAFLGIVSWLEFALYFFWPVWTSFNKKEAAFNVALMLPQASWFAERNDELDACCKFVFWYCEQKNVEYPDALLRMQAMSINYRESIKPYVEKLHKDFVYDIMTYRRDWFSEARQKEIEEDAKVRSEETIAQDST